MIGWIFHNYPRISDWFVPDYFFAGKRGYRHIISAYSIISAFIIVQKRYKYICESKSHEQLHRLLRQNNKKTPKNILISSRFRLSMLQCFSATLFRAWCAILYTVNWHILAKAKNKIVTATVVMCRAKIRERFMTQRVSNYLPKSIHYGPDLDARSNNQRVIINDSYPT